MAVLKTYEKTPTAVLDYSIDWSSWLASGESISTSTWSVPAGITKDSDTNDTDSTTIWLSGGTAGTSYLISNTIVTNAATARTETRSFSIAVVAARGLN